MCMCWLLNCESRLYVTKIHNPYCDARVSECLSVYFEKIYSKISMNVKIIVEYVSHKRCFFASWHPCWWLWQIGCAEYSSGSQTAKCLWSFAAIEGRITVQEGKHSLRLKKIIHCIFLTALEISMHMGLFSLWLYYSLFVLSFSVRD